jgi:type I restriction-modification system DNA methylase subunit
MDNVTRGDYIAVIDFKDNNNVLKSIPELAAEIKSVIDNDLNNNQPVSLPMITYNNVEYFVDWKLQEVRNVKTAEPTKFTDIQSNEFKAALRFLRAEKGPNVNMPGLDDIVPKTPESVPESSISVIKSDYANEFELNKGIEKLLDKKWNANINDWSAAELEFLTGYTGYGGLDKHGEITKGSLFEYFTPESVIEKMWGLAYKFGYKDGPMIEPSCGPGEFFNRKYVSNLVEKHGYEINKYSARIAKLLYPEAIINDGEEIKYFEQLFIVKNYTVRDKVTPKYDLVIGNPPYGTVGGIYMGMGEKSFTHANNYIDYFILRGLDLLKKGGLLIYIIGAETAGGGVPFLDQGMNKVKEMINERGKLIDAYRLPSGVFSRTDVTSDIVVFRKR